MAKRRENQPDGPGNRPQGSRPPESAEGGSRLQEGGGPPEGSAPGESPGGSPDGGAPARTLYDSVRENAEALVVAVILAVIIRHFTVEAFEIPTGSMANTLFGIHTWLKCPNCDTDFNVALASDSSSGKVNVPYRPLKVYKGDCPNPTCGLSIHSISARRQPLAGPGDRILCTACGTVFQGDPRGFADILGLDRRPARCPICQFTYVTVIEQKEQYGGNKILVDKLAFVFGDPKRWDVFVFEFDQWKNYIKRLVGLPGERIDVWDGDLYVNGAIERKSRHAYIQDVLWTKISDTDVPERGIEIQAPLLEGWPYAPWARLPWRELSPGDGPRAGRQDAEWKADVRRWSVNATGGRIALEYQRGFDNYYSYNLLRGGSAVGSYPDGVQVGDKKAAFTVHVAGVSPPPVQPPLPGPGGSWVGAELRDGDFTFRLAVPVGSDAGLKATLERIGPSTGAPSVPPLRAEAAFAIPPRRDVRIELENADDRVAARLDGVELLVLEYRSLPEGASLLSPPEGPGERRGEHFLRLVCQGVQAELSSIQVYRDMYYIPETNHGERWRGIQLGEGEYLAMGDNAPSSADGRYWGAVPEKNLMGKALLVFWPAWPTNFQCKFIK